MIRWVLFLIGLGAVAYGASWLADHPGHVTIEWLGGRLDTPFAFLLVFVIGLIVVCAVLFHLWRKLVRTPRGLGRRRRESRQRRGYEALSRGLVAVAAGDATAAARHATKADDLLSGQPLTLLLSAQAAQLQGDQQAANRFFHAMLERPETSFLAVRGLLANAIKEENWTEAVRLARRAHRLQPNSQWVTERLFELQQRTGAWTDAEQTVEEMRRKKLLAVGDAMHQRAEFQYRLSLEKDGDEAIRWARKALDSDPSLTPAAVRLARLWLGQGRPRKAAAVVEQAWAKAPHADLLDLYWEARKADDAKQKIAAAQRLAKANPDHLESRLAIATAALEAHQWGEARANLEPVAGDDASPRVCRLMAQLEESEHGDLARARAWLVKAAGETETPAMSTPLPQAAS